MNGLRHLLCGKFVYKSALMLETTLNTPKILYVFCGCGSLIVKVMDSKTSHVEGLMHAKSVEADSSPVVMV
ncbi:hypothetical protein TNCV_4052621 [Trichonephila clavipes]|nr:hypothetical protein TNCV_4052621 [Trichonephila clavipes]